MDRCFTHFGKDHFYENSIHNTSLLDFSVSTGIYTIPKTGSMYTPLLSNGLTQINPSDNGSFIAKCSHLSPARRTGAPHMGSAWFLPPPPSHTTEQTPVPMINILRLVRCVPSLCLSASPPPSHPSSSLADLVLFLPKKTLFT